MCLTPSPVCFRRCDAARGNLKAVHKMRFIRRKRTPPGFGNVISPIGGSTGSSSLFASTRKNAAPPARPTRRTQRRGTRTSFAYPTGTPRRDERQKATSHDTLPGPDAQAQPPPPWADSSIGEAAPFHGPGTARGDLSETSAPRINVCRNGLYTGLCKVYTQDRPHAAYTGQSSPHLLPVRAETCSGDLAP